ncbi:MAG: hypothetical protein QY325_13645 [Flavobacteriales bacterium]|nr:MAG: hypothetical protein QY325_13645 [Flavobacteriales bacterium]
MSAGINPTQWPYPGARWWKCDLHNHTPASADYGAGPNQAALKARTPQDWLLDYMRAGIDCVGVTDHNSGAWIDQLKTALAHLDDTQPAGYRPLVIFPGVELSIGRIHALVLLDPDKGSADVEGIIGYAQFNGTRGDSDSACLNSPTAIAAEVHRRGGLFIPAHADNTKGIFHELHGNDLRPFLDIESVVGIELLAEPIVWPSLYTERKLHWTPIVGSDAHHPDDQGRTVNNYPGRRWTWIKMGRPTIDGLRLALLDGALSVSRILDPASVAERNRTPDRLITRVEVNGTKVMGNGAPVQLALSPWLNAVIGDRGTGKSSFVHFVRQALARNKPIDLGGENSRPWATFSSFMKPSTSRNGDGVLRTNALLKVHYWLNGTEFVISSQGGTKDHLVDEVQPEGTVKRAGSQEVRDRFKVTLVSQDQLAELVENGRGGLLGYVDEAIDRLKWQAEQDERNAQFLAISANRREQGTQLAQEDRLKAQLEDIGRKLAQFEGSDHARILKEFQRQSRQSREVQSLFSELDAIGTDIQRLEEGIGLSDMAEGVFEADSSAEAEVLETYQRLVQAVNSAKAKLKEARELLATQGRMAQKVLNESEWAANVKAAREAHEQLIDRLRASGVNDPEQFGQLVQQRHVVEGQLKRLEEVKVELHRLDGMRAAAIRALRSHRLTLSRERARFLTEVLKDNRFVRMQVVAFGDEMEHLVRNMREWLDLQGDGFGDDLTAMAAELYNALPGELEARMTEFLRRLDTLKDELLRVARGERNSKWSGWLNNRIIKMAAERPEFFDRIESWYPEDGIAVEYNATSREGGQRWKDVKTGSAGQRSAALLAFLLSYGEEPIILDQPEDDLDNQVVFDLVVQGIRENKQRRQIIVITHDANIVVNGDAEAVHVMEFRDQCHLQLTESLQNSALRDLVCRVMEGGKKAFENRYQRLIGATE